MSFFPASESFESTTAISSTPSYFHTYFILLTTHSHTHTTHNMSRKTLNFDDDVKAYLDEQDNASAEANRAMKAWIRSDNGETGVLRLRLRQVRGDITDCENRLSNLREEEERLEEELAEAENERRENERDALEEAMSMVSLTTLSSGPAEPKDMARWDAVCDEYDVAFDDLLEAKRENNA